MTESSEYFQIEAAERLERLRSGLLALERTPDDASLVTDLFREVHSLKGAAGIVGLSEISEVCHEMENRLSVLREADQSVSPSLIDALIDGTGVVETLLASGMDASEHEVLVKEVIARIAALAGQEIDASEASADVFIGRSEPSAKGLLADESQREEPAREEDARPEPLPPETSAAAPAPTVEVVRLDRKRLDAVADLAGELWVASGRLRHRGVAIRRLHAQIRSATRSASGSPGVGEMLGQIEKAARELVDDTAGDLSIIDPLIDELHENVLDCQLLPLSTLFDELPRFARDHCRREGKEVELLVSGGDTRVDRKILGQLRDPIIHLIRNAVSHGIESPEERESRGKPRRGSLHLRTARHGDRTQIVCEDDGRGIDTEKVLAKAIEAGEITQEESTKLTTSQIERLILRPGLSTAAEVSELCGRGVGMDVVADRIEALSGTLEIESEREQFTRFVIEFPASVATVSALLVDVGGERCALPTASFSRTASVAVSTLQRNAGQVMAEIEGVAVPVVMLADLLGRGRESEACEDKIPVVVVRYRNHDVAVGVDRLHGIQSLVIRGLGDHLGSVPGVAGATILGNGLPALVLEPCDLLKLAGRRAHDSLSPIREPVSTDEPQPEPTTILIVDDSLTTRMMEKSILESAGYHVDLAVSAEDALVKVESSTYCLFIIDVEMPGLNGFQLTARLRQLKSCAETPIIIVSSLATQGHLQQGVDAGADDYIIKGEFDQRRLLAAVETLGAR